MKKIVVLSLIALLVLAFGTMAFAQAKKEEPKLNFVASGFIDVIGNYIRNVPQAGASTSAGGATGPADNFFGPPVAYMMPANKQAFDKKMAYVENRGRLKFDAIMGKEMMGTFFFEFDSTRWGERIPAGSTAQRQYAGFWGVADRSSLELKNMFLTFAMPWVPVPITVQAGIIPKAIRPNFFLAVDGPGIQTAIKIDPAQVNLFFMKALENKDWAADDTNLYGIDVLAKISTITVGGYAVYFNMNSYPVGDGEPSYSSEVGWYGVYANGKLGPVNLSGDLIINRGEIEDRRDTLARGRDVKLRGWGGILRVSYPWEKFNFGFSSIYGSGADQNKTSSNGLPGSYVASGSGTSRKVGAYIVPAGTEGSPGHSIILAGNGIINRSNTGFEPGASTSHARAAFGGLLINKLFGSIQVTPIYKVTVEGMYVRDTTKHGNTIGNARKAPYASTNMRDDKSIGWEFDLYNEVKLYKNLTFALGGGILFAGKAMDYWDTSSTLTDKNVSPKNPWIIATSITYSF